MKRIVRLDNPVQSYAWGSRTYIAELLGAAVPSSSPQAELWMGAHPKSPSRVLLNGDSISLQEWIRKDPEAVLGKDVVRTFSHTLPFLFKVLASEKPLSIQVHPDAEQAREGFAREEEAGIPLTDPRRNYRDPFPKPELIRATTPFWALCGFREPREIRRWLQRLELDALLPEWEEAPGGRPEESLRRFFRRTMALDGERCSRVVSRVVELAERRTGECAEYRWLARCGRTFPGDLGVLFVVFLNLVRLEPGDAMYLPPRRLHAYLEGAGIELMANSDNVLRGGLTSKHVDCAELLRVADFSPRPPHLVRAVRKGGERRYETPAREFLLTEISLVGGATYTSPGVRSVEILLCFEGEGRIFDLETRVPVALQKGVSVLIPACLPAYRLEGELAAFVASVPLS